MLVGEGHYQGYKELIFLVILKEITGGIAMPNMKFYLSLSRGLREEWNQRNNRRDFDRDTNTSVDKFGKSCARARK